MDLRGFALVETGLQTLDMKIELLLHPHVIPRFLLQTLDHLLIVMLRVFALRGLLR